MKRAFQFVAVVLGIVVAASRPAEALFAPRGAAGSVRLFVDVPPELSTYTGRQPVTLGLPFSDGLLHPGDGCRVVDAGGVPQLAQFQVTSSWESQDVRWLLVDLIASIRNGQPPALFLVYGPSVPRGPTRTPLVVTNGRGAVSVSTGALDARFALAGSSLGKFALEGITPPGAPVVYAPQAQSVSVELFGPVRAVVKLCGDYVAPNGAKVAEFVMRFRFYAGLPFARVYHTFVWTSDAATQIGSLRFTATLGSASQITTAVDGTTVAASGSFVLKQTDWNAAVDANGLGLGQQWDGWVEMKDPNRSIVAALRWPWQQHPAGLAVSGGTVAIGLIDPISPISLAANDVVIPPLKNFDNGYYVLATGKGPYGPLCPRGVAKTHELLLWIAQAGSHDYGVSAAIKNAVLQHPIAGYADPAFASQAALPSPMSPCDPASFPEIEGAIERSFDWYTRQRAGEWDFGLWNFGDDQYDWNGSVGSPALVDGHYRPDRYWLNNGKGWSLTPWLLWMRSGNRKYLERGESHARHVMDVDTCHVTNVAEFKYRGGSYGYSLLHFGQESWPVDISNDSEYLPYCYFLTGYERARDVMQERVEGILATYPNNALVPDVDDMQAFLSQDYVIAPGVVASKTLLFNREHYRTLGELALLYENTLDPALQSKADPFLADLYAAQATNGWISGLKTNFWFSQSLNVAQRAFPSERSNLRELMRRYEEFEGNYLVPGVTGQVDGPRSLWTLLTLEEHTGDPNYLTVAAEVARTQALGIYEDLNEWRGFGTPPMHEFGPIVRDWVAVMGRLSRLPPSQRPSGLARATYFNAGLTTLVPSDAPRQFYGRHVLFVLDESDAPIQVTLDYNALNGGYGIANRIRVIAPNGAETVIDRVLEPEPTEVLTLLNYPLLTPPYTTEAASHFDKATTLDLAPDGQTGAYAIEFYSTNLETPVFARSSAGKLVHYFPEYQERAQHVAPWDLYFVHGSQMPSVTSPFYAAQAWFQPKGSLVDVTLVHAGYVLHVNGGLPTSPVGPDDPVYTINTQSWPLVRAFRNDGVALGRTAILGTTTDGFTNPSGIAAVFTPATTSLHSFVTQNESWHLKMFLAGMEPFVAATDAEWFDPRLYPSPPLAQFLVPRD